MVNFVVESFVKKLMPWFERGKHWKLLIPVLLVAVIFEVVKELLSLSGWWTTVTSPYFFIPSVLVVLLCLIYYWKDTHISPPEDCIVIAVTSFYPVSEDAKNEAANSRHEVVTVLRKRMKEYGIRGKVKKLDETINPEEEEGQKEAFNRGRENGAHVVISGTVRVEKNHEVYFWPYITRLVDHPYRYSPQGDEATKTETKDEYKKGYEFIKMKANEIADLATLICGMARLNSSQYEEADKILSTISQPTADVWFYRGFALLRLDKRETDAKSCFDEAVQQDPNFVYAWIYLGKVSRELGEEDSAKIAFDKARGIVEPSWHGTDKDFLLKVEQAESLLNSLNESVSISQQVNKTLQENGKKFIEVGDNLTKVFKAEDLISDGKKLYRKGNYEGAIEMYDQALEFYPDNGSALASKGFALRKLAKSDEAMNLLRKAVKLECDDITLARAYAVLGDRERTLDHLSKSLEQDSQNPFPTLAIKVEIMFYDEFKPYRSDEAFTRLIAEAKKRTKNSNNSRGDFTTDVRQN